MQTRPILAAILTCAILSGCATTYQSAPRSAVGTKRGTAPENNRMLVWHASLSLESDSVEATVERVAEITTAAGGYVQSKSDSTESRAYLTLRVPVKSLDTTMASLESVGKVTSRRVSSEDVTEQYVDMDARLKTLITLRDRLRNLLDKAKDVQDVLAIEKELSRVQGNLDSLQARLKALKGKVDLASITVSIRRTRILGPVGYVLKGVFWTIEKLFVIRQ